MARERRRGGAWLWAVPLAVLVSPWSRCRRCAGARWRWDIRDEGIDIQHGTLAISRTLVPWVRVQHVDTQRGVFEQTFGLATVVVHTAAGGHTIPLLPAGDAEQLRERIAGLARTRGGPDEPERRAEACRPRRLRSAAVVYSADALRSAAFPLIVIVGMSLLGGGFDVRDLLRAAVYGAIGVTVSVVMGYLRWRTTTYWVGERRSTTTPGSSATRTPTCHWRGSRRSTSTKARCSGCSACSPSTSRPARAARAARSRCRR